jgi:hypothetical protein
VKLVPIARRVFSGVFSATLAIAGLWLVGVIFGLGFMLCIAMAKLTFGWLL